MKLEWFAMPNSNAAPMLFFFFFLEQCQREENGKKKKKSFLLYNMTESATKSIERLMQEKI